MALTALKLGKLKPKAKIYRIADGNGLCIEVHPAGGKYWRFRYRYAGKAKMISLGTYPDVGPGEARDRREAAARLLRDGTDPSTERQKQAAGRLYAHANTFEAVGQEWLAKQKDRLAATTYSKAEWMLTELAFPWLGSRPIATIEAPDVLPVLRRVEERGKLETAHRLKQRISQVFRFAVATRRATRDPMPDLRGALATAKTENHASIKTDTELGGLLRAIHGYQGTLVVGAR